MKKRICYRICFGFSKLQMLVHLGTNVHSLNLSFEVGVKYWNTLIVFVHSIIIEIFELLEMLTINDTILFLLIIIGLILQLIKIWLSGFLRPHRSLLLHRWRCDRLRYTLRLYALRLSTFGLYGMWFWLLYFIKLCSDI